MYYVITAGDGDASIDVIDKETLLRHMEEHYYGDPATYLATSLPVDGDLNYLGDKFIIIKGEIITPTPKAVVETWEIE